MLNSLTVILALHSGLISSLGMEPCYKHGGPLPSTTPHRLLFFFIAISSLLFLLLASTSPVTLKWLINNCENRLLLSCILCVPVIWGQFPFSSFMLNIIQIVWWCPHLLHMTKCCSTNSLLHLQHGSHLSHFSDDALFSWPHFPQWILRTPAYRKSSPDVEVRVSVTSYTIQWIKLFLSFSAFHLISIVVTWNRSACCLTEHGKRWFKRINLGGIKLGCDGLHLHVRQPLSGFLTMIRDWS